MAVTVSYVALTCAGETLASMFLSALVNTHLVALKILVIIANIASALNPAVNACFGDWFQNSFTLLVANKPGIKGDHSQNQPKLKDADGEDNDDDNDDGDDGGGEYGDGEEELSSEGGEYGNNGNSEKNNPKKGLGDGATGAEQNGEDEDNEDGDGEDPEDEDEDEDEDDDDDDDGEDEDEEDVEEEENEDEEEEDEDEEALQPPKKRKK
ncbi:hypothetical protein Gotur_019128 [Gossypium turneri]